MNLFRIVCIMMAVLLVGIPAMGQPVSLDGTEQSSDDEPSWVTRNLDRYFGRPQKEESGDIGQALEIVDQYLEYSGLPIEVVIVYQVENFNDGWDEEKNYSTRTLNNLTNPLHSYTRDILVRNYLTFKQGDKLDPFALADSERLLRDLEFISDVRIVLLRLKGEIESVAVVVEVEDRWPIGVEGKVVTAEKFSFKFYSSNLMGHGLKFTNEFLYQKDGKPSWGYEGNLRKENIAGSFVDAELGFEDSYRRLERKILLERRLVYPGLNSLGGVLFDQVQTRDRETPSKYELSDVWVGRNFRLYNPYERTTTARSVLVPAVTAYRKIFTDRPFVEPDTNRSYHNRKAILLGLTYKRLKSYKTSYLFQDGEIEDYPKGFVLKGTVGYEIREFEERLALALESMVTSIRNSGGIVFARFNVGGYLRDHKMEEGVFLTGGGYISRLYGKGRYHHRLYSRGFYSLGLGRYPNDYIYLDDKAGIRGLSSGQVSGNQRIVGNFEYRLFTPLSVLGFRLSLQFFTDVGIIAGEDDPIFKKKIYTSSGVGFRMRNPRLVLPTVQLRVSLLSNIDESGVALSVKIGNVGSMEVDLPSVKPSVLSYQ